MNSDEFKRFQSGYDPGEIKIESIHENDVIETFQVPLKWNVEEYYYIEVVENNIIKERSRKCSLMEAERILDNLQSIHRNTNYTFRLKKESVK